jgi:hypothetical protein
MFERIEYVCVPSWFFDELVFSCGGSACWRCAVRCAGCELVDSWIRRRFEDGSFFSLCIRFFFYLIFFTFIIIFIIIVIVSVIIIIIIIIIVVIIIIIIVISSSCNSRR